MCQCAQCAPEPSPRIHNTARQQADGVHSPDCEEPDPKSRQVRRKPKQHRAVAGFMVGVLGGLSPLKFTCPAA